MKKITFDTIHRDSFPIQVMIRLANDRDKDDDCFDSLAKCRAVLTKCMLMDVFVSLEVLVQEGII